MKKQEGRKERVYKEIDAFGFTFKVQVLPTGKPGKLERDILAVKAILDKGVDNLTYLDRLSLLHLYNVAFHDGGKIEGVCSLDSSATNCEFCVKMRKLAEKNPDLICGHCYDFEQEHGFKGVNVLGRHTLNMVIMSSVDFTVDELSMLMCSGIARVNSSGDAPNTTYACNMIKYAIAHPTAKVAIWSKNTFVYIYACNLYGKPENVVLIQSSPYINKPVKLAKYFDYVFTVYKDPAAVAAALAGGACECNGKKCLACGYKCYFGTWEKGSDIAELLR